MVKSNDGFHLAEVDLDLRGEGTIMGERQKGRNDLRLASLRRDKEWVAKARSVAIRDHRLRRRDERLARARRRGRVHAWR